MLHTEYDEASVVRKFKRQVERERERADNAEAEVRDLKAEVEELKAELAKARGLN